VQYRVWFLDIRDVHDLKRLIRFVTLSFGFVNELKEIGLESLRENPVLRKGTASAVP
jgi:hypothetical protein